MANAEPEFRPRPMSRRSWTVVGAIALVVVVLYFLVAHFYNAEGVLTSTDNVGPTDNGVSVVIEPMAVDAQINQARVDLRFRTGDPDLAEADGRLTENIRVVITSASGATELRFPAGTIPTQDSVALGLDGEVAQYPFDVHSGGGDITADTYTRNSDGTFTSKEQLFVSASATGGVNGWDTAITIDELPASVSVGMTFQRAFSTQVFALLILVLAVVLAVLALVAGLLVHSRRRKAEVALLSWAAALLFALPALRNYMPNAPPIGASIDIYVFLWVMVAAVVAAGLVTLAWITQSGRPGPAHVVASGENDVHAT